MATEIERKYLVTGDQWRDGAVGSQFRQGYLARDPGRSVRVRIAADEAWLNIKGATKGISRQEFEYRIPLDDALALLALSVDPPIEKTRYLIKHEGHLWEVDEFHGANDGLLVAEIELESESNEFPLPPWVGDEVSGDPRYCNACLSKRPFRTW
jgi:adenylate cyclase